MTVVGQRAVRNPSLEQTAYVETLDEERQLSERRDRRGRIPFDVDSSPECIERNLRVEGGRRGSQGVAGAKISVSGSTTEQVTSQDGVTQLLLDDGEVPIQINGAPGYTGPVASLKPKEVFTKTGQRLAA